MDEESYQYDSSYYSAWLTPVAAYSSGGPTRSLFAVFPEKLPNFGTFQSFAILQYYRFGREVFNLPKLQPIDWGADGQ